MYHMRTRININTYIYIYILKYIEIRCNSIAGLSTKTPACQVPNLIHWEYSKYIPVSFGQGRVLEIWN